jgi:hypothetical protein
MESIGNWDSQTNVTAYTDSLQRYSMPMVGVKLGIKKYFNSPWNNFTSGFQIQVRRAYSIYPEFTSSQTIGVGYTGILRIKEQQGLELNANIGLSGIGWNFEELAVFFFDFLPIYISEDYTFGALISPEVKYRHRQFSIGLEYAYFFDLRNTSSDRNVKYSSFCLSLGKKF